MDTYGIPICGWKGGWKTSEGSLMISNQQVANRWVEGGWKDAETEPREGVRRRLVHRVYCTRLGAPPARQGFLHQLPVPRRPDEV